MSAGHFVVSAPTVACWSVSPFLKIIPRIDGTAIAYHSLFGNCSLLDHELADALQSLRSLDSIDEGDTKRQLGKDTWDALLNSYYISADGEERNIVESWLKDRVSLVSDGAMIGGLQITTSNACNFSCSYCFADASDRRSPRRQSGISTPNISFDTASLAIDRVRETALKHGKSKIGVKFLGREPLVNFPVISRLIEQYDTHEVAWSLTTNGSLVTDEIARQLAGANVRVIVSIDGLPAVNDLQRTVKAGRAKSAYDLAFRGLRLLREHGVETSVSSVVSIYTCFDQLEDFFREIQSVGCRELEMTLAMQTDLLQIQSKFPTIGELVENLADAYRLARNLKISLSGDWIDPFHAVLVNRKFRSDSSMLRPFGAGCQATEHQISVEPNGDLFPCRAMSLHYGSLLDWEGVLKSEAYKKVVMRTYYAVPFCHGCELEGHCQGTCLGSLEESSGNIYNPQHAYCDVYRQVTEHLLRNYDMAALGHPS